ncbi:MAG: DUF192 domain-containing protein [Chloroflexi bacterium]|nr:DUF192 domain-containing protein [Chloroflexota bacterium]
MTIVANAIRRTVLAARADTARGPWKQFKGLMGRADLLPGTGLVLPNTRGVHTHFMRFPIDVVFYDKNLVVLDVAHALRPWRLSAYHLRAKGVVELPAGTAAASATRRGDVLSFTEPEPNHAASAMHSPSGGS